MIQVRTLAAALALGASVLGGNAWGALCDSSSMSLGGFTATCQQFSGGATATFPGLVLADVPAANSEWRSLGVVSGDKTEGGLAFGMSWTLDISLGASSGTWSLTGANASQSTPVDVLAYVLLNTGSGQTRDEYLAFYITGPTWTDTLADLSGRFSFSDGASAIENNGVFVYGLQRTSIPTPVPEPVSIALLGALSLGFLGARGMNRRG